MCDTKLVSQVNCAMSIRRSGFSLFLLLLAIVVMVTLPGWAVSYQPVSPDELKMTSEPKAPGAPAIILFRQVDRDDRGLTAHEDVYFRIKILTEDGRKYADIEIPFFKEEGKVVNLHARTIKPDGTIVEFSGKAFRQVDRQGARREIHGQDLHSARRPGRQRS